MDDEPLKETKKLNTSKKKPQASINDQMSSSKWVPIVIHMSISFSSLERTRFRRSSSILFLFVQKIVSFQHF